ncbi:hypothetical protein CPC08DRAFT_824841 [Agrocybe pediades]|nr:hypothetical protein CPC08DRAFT_824841 [Agrocybe pediades]
MKEAFMDYSQQLAPYISDVALNVTVEERSSPDASQGTNYLHESKSAETLSPGPMENPPRLCVADSMLLSQQGMSESYISAILSMVQILPKKLCFLKLNIQSVGSLTHRIDCMTIKWHFKRPSLGKDAHDHRPRIVDIAPKQSSGARCEEFREKDFRLQVPLQANFAGITAGPEVGGQVTTQKKVERATGS